MHGDALLAAASRGSNNATPPPACGAGAIPAGLVAAALPPGLGLQAPAAMGGAVNPLQQALFVQMQQNQLLMQQQAQAGLVPPVLAAQYGGMQAAAVHTLQAANVYAQAVSDKIEPEVQELADHFKLDERITKDLAIQLNRRNNTMDDDLKSLWQILEGARSPQGLLRVKIKEMEDGSFRGIATPDKDIEDMAKKYGLDAQAAAKLADVLGKRPDRKKDMRQLNKHLELSNKPSALIMLMLKDLRSGKAIADPEYPAAVGSYAHKKGLRRHERSRSRKKKRRDVDSESSSPPPQRSRSRSRGGGKSSGGPKPESVSGPRPMTLLERFG
mmetsp:Transcript_12191/g.22480  ORF Transcript_12191/g.22480 Transcript_12191/m.22480 type:complete len:328 (-) Transcript_12191:81-1064(-)